jgi:hypothetical protein
VPVRLSVLVKAGDKISEDNFSQQLHVIITEARDGRPWYNVPCNHYFRLSVALKYMQLLHPSLYNLIATF